MGGGLHFCQIKHRFNDRFHGSHHNRHVVRQAARHDGGDSHLFHGGDAMGRAHGAQDHIRILAGSQHHAGDPFSRGNNHR